ncbi:uncharacterized protein LOC130629018 [Hydractinia symbiolongicarpus]|uniref:uncharacterized protein LOC130629018 n=1 Tax=Hydractinia symbiolongicarpus TaxID=13093 RepID=UPI00254C987D|nr:uncharacterized protein LOC130629018 [Hydractinia symbiolongicarpus]
MVSFDVTSLYTNVPIKDTLNIIKDLIENNAAFGEKTKIPVPDFLRLVELVLTKTWYLFKKNFYTQTDGVAMGGPASSVVTEIYMQAHETTALVTSDRRPKDWRRFVDEVFAIIKRSHLEEFHEHIIGLHRQIKFTVELEHDGSIAFLDTLVKRKNGSISVSVYRKPTHTDQYLNVELRHQKSCKESVISALLNRANSVVSDKQERKIEIRRVRNALIGNGYSHKVITQVENKIKRRCNGDSKETSEEFIAAAFLPFVPGTSEILRRVLRQHKIKFLTLKSTLSKPKDKINLEEQSNVVYEIPCKDCDAVYIGETKRKFKQRVQEHMRAVRNRDVKKNEIADHSWSRSHQFNWDEKKIIDRESRTTARKIKETINSVERNKHINSISYQLSEIWLPALQKK